ARVLQRRTVTYACARAPHEFCSQDRIDERFAVTCSARPAAFDKVWQHDSWVFNAARARVDALRTPLLNFVQPFGELDVGAPRVRDERDRDVHRRDLPVGLINLDAQTLEFLQKRLEVLYFEPDVIEDVSACAND